MIRATLLSLLVSFPLFAVDFTVTPSSGPTAGGTEVTIKGEFGAWPYTVLFDGAAAKSTTLVDSHTIVAVTPTHFPGTTRVVVFEYDFGIDTGKSFTFVGGPPPEYERILVPLLTPPVQGAFGSEFHTELRAHNASNSDVWVTGIARICIISPCPLPSTVIGPGADLGDFELSGTPGRFLYVPVAQAPYLSFNLRVRDVTRQALNFGTEIPVVHERELSGDAITLLGVPTDPRYRNTLRIYGSQQTFLNVRFTDGVESFDRGITLQAGRHSFEPAYAMIGDFPVFASGAQTITVKIEAPPTLGPLPPVPVWAFISVTNNETQVITTITPQR